MAQDKKQNPDLEGMLKNIPSESDKPPFKELLPEISSPFKDLEWENPKKYLEKLEYALSLYPGEREKFLGRLGELYLTIGKVKDAAEIYEEAINTRSISYFFPHAARCYYSMWEFEKAEEILKNAITNQPDVLDNFINLSDYYMQEVYYRPDQLEYSSEYDSAFENPPEKDLKKAIRVLESGLKRIPEYKWSEESSSENHKIMNSRIYRLLTNAYVEAGDYHNAIEHCNSLVNFWKQYHDGTNEYMDSKVIESLIKMGDIHIQFDKIEEGIIAYESAHSLLDEPNFHDWKRLGDIYTKGEKLGKALDAYSKAEDLIK